MHDPTTPVGDGRNDPGGGNPGRSAEKGYDVGPGHGARQGDQQAVGQPVDPERGRLPAPDATANPKAAAGVSLLWSYARPHAKTLALTLLLGLLGTATILLLPLMTKWVLDSLESGLQIGRPVTILLGSLAVGTLAGFAQVLLLGRVAERIVFTARKNLILRFLRSKLEQVQRFRAGELVTRVTSDTELLRGAATSSLVDLVNGSISLVGTVALMAFLDWSLLGTTLIAILIVGVMFGIFMPFLSRANKRAQDAIGILGATLETGVRALRTIKASGAEASEAGRITAHAKTSEEHLVRGVWFSSASFAVAGGGVQVALIAILAIGAGRVASGELAVSTLIAFLLYAFNIVDPIITLAAAIATLQSGLAAAARIRETEHLEFEDTAARPEGHHPAQKTGVGPVLALRNVTARYGRAEAPAVAELSLEIPRTGHVAIVGPSGAGKTTVLSLLLRFLSPDYGHLELNGVPFDKLSIDDVRERIAYVEQDTPVMPGTVRDNVLLGASFHGNAPPSRAACEAPAAGVAHAPGTSGQHDEREAKAWAALAAVMLEDKVRSLDGGLDAEVTDTNLSGGERQRLAVARALVRGPEVLLLDEATAQLDGVTEAAIQRAIAQAATVGAVVTIAHRLSTVVDADCIMVLENGSLRASGTHDELLASDRLYRGFVEALRIGRVGE